jgi:hypothetical protein
MKTKSIKVGYMITSCALHLYMFIECTASGSTDVISVLSVSPHFVKEVEVNCSHWRSCKSRQSYNLILHTQVKYEFRMVANGIRYVQIFIKIRQAVLGLKQLQ